jgi:hypothetical protein
VQGLGNSPVDDFALVRNAGIAKDWVVHVDLQSAILNQQLQEIADVLRIELAGMHGNGCGKVQRT